MRNTILAVAMTLFAFPAMADHGLHHFGVSLSISGDRVAIGSSYGTGKSPVGIGSGKKTGNVRLYRFDGLDFFQTNSIFASDGIPGDEFGHSVQLDGLDFATGAFNANDLGEGAGAAYMWTATSDSWTEAILGANDGAKGDGFGASVSFSSEMVIVGAPGNDEKGDNAGAAYGFRRSSTGFSQFQKISPTDPSANQRFGEKVSVLGNTTVFISASGDSENGSNSGAVYVFEYDGNQWIQSDKLNPKTSVAGARFGNSLLSADSRLVVGSFFDSSDGVSKGAVYIFKKIGGVWTEEVKLSANDGVGGDNFGRSVAIDARRIIVGSPINAESGLSSGSAYVFKIESGQWSLEQKLRPKDGKANMNFGSTVVIEDDMLLVSALNSNSTQVGSVYFYHLDTSLWSEHTKLTFEEIFPNVVEVDLSSSRVTDEVSDADYYGEDKKAGGCFLK